MLVKSPGRRPFCTISRQDCSGDCWTHKINKNMRTLKKKPHSSKANPYMLVCELCISHVGHLAKTQGRYHMYHLLRMEVRLSGCHFIYVTYKLCLLCFASCLGIPMPGIGKTLTNPTENTYQPCRVIHQGLCKPIFAAFQDCRMVGCKAPVRS